MMLGRWFRVKRGKTQERYFLECGIGSHRRQGFHGGEDHQQGCESRKQPGGALNSKTESESRPGQGEMERRARSSPGPRRGCGLCSVGPCPGRSSWLWGGQVAGAPRAAGEAVWGGGREAPPRQVSDWIKRPV